ncbi:class I SAM-dependent methyltransferase [Desulfitobacterium chlororespirans]|uniref:Methyltransferase domain-containing protein n=1 Tax=Desulfitobacterium chlororespirans DSM 11544 TaxID=1121395 RepID=A0A1M7S3W0_9FIRM|nr:class I SAM-dependent methyltransferase [Desulfitobacterium chlororespirans]SHN53359.1 Methyltransferase domain-containing protein [Desulfitobacterium chlororespirans DSM 11544]
MSKLAIVNNYWSTQAEAFTEISIDELTSEKNALWQSILEPFVQIDRKLEILDVGCGAGFFEIFLSGMGHHVTAVDFNGKMLEEARKNIQKLGRPELT